MIPVAQISEEKVGVVLPYGKVSDKVHAYRLPRMCLVQVNSNTCSTMLETHSE